jgi:hypothetical protein
MMMRSIVPAMLVALAGCSSGSQAPTPTPSPSTVAPAISPAPSASPSAAPLQAAPTSVTAAEATQDSAVLDNRDCRTVAQAYTQAIARNDFAFAVRVWNDPAIDAARLKAAFANYAIPQIEISKVQLEGAAGSSYCTVTGKLTDVADPNKRAQAGDIVLRRVNDVPGATPEQLRWTIRSSTFVEKPGRPGKGRPT